MVQLKVEPKRAERTSAPPMHLRRNLTNLAILVFAGMVLIVLFAPLMSEALDQYKTPRGYSVFANVSPTYYYFKCGMVWGFQGRISISYPGEPTYRLPNNTNLWQFTCD